MSLISLLMLSTFAIDGLEQSLAKDQPIWTPLGSVLAQGFKTINQLTQQSLHLSIWWFHYLLILSFLVYIPYSKHLHIMASVFNIFFASTAPKGALKFVNLEASESFGTPAINKFTRKQLLDLVSCTECGRCQVNCPAFLTGKDLSPKKVILDLKHDLLEEGPALIKPSANGDEKQPRPLIGPVITEQVIWDCTTCRACQEQCPVLIEHVDKIVDMRRNLILEQGKVPESAAPALRSLEDRGHPWRGTTASRTDWAKGLKTKPAAQNNSFDILYWVGCTAALEGRNIKVANAFGRLMESAGVNFGYLGVEETCCGEPARRFGNEYLFQTQTVKNIETLAKYNVKTIVTACPHCFNT
ncbi:MAG: (Fe-S)-binding protein, partial [Dehalococcoidia bacterium]|nr:(Fe-S)-binding protein [Dehalococcoidia bacterium]